MFLQLIISITVLFCSVVFIRQILFLQQVDLGINRDRVVVVSAECCELPAHFSNSIKQIPGVVDALPVSTKLFLGDMLNTDAAATSVFYTEINGERQPLNIAGISTVSQFFDFFEIKFIKGSSFRDDGVGRQILANPAIGLFEEFENEMVINETANINIENPILFLRESEIRITGVVKDFHISPISAARPIHIHFAGYDALGAIAYRYLEGHREQTEVAITQWLHEEFPDKGKFEIEFTYMEDVFNENFKSELRLLKLLWIMTVVCILIAIFGAYSLTSLTCSQRRKEIAVRKVYGATVLDIIILFVKEYLILLTIAAFVAFPAGLIIMKRWIETYVKQTPIDAWIYISIYLFILSIILISTISIIFRSANKNPAERLKNE